MLGMKSEMVKAEKLIKMKFISFKIVVVEEFPIKKSQSFSRLRFDFFSAIFFLHFSSEIL
jgi:hypothetical protein